MALAYPATGELANLSCSAGSGDLLYLFGTAMRIGSDVATLNLEAGELEMTAANSSSAVSMLEYANGLITGTIDFSGIWPKTSGAATGITSLITYASGYVAYCNSWQIDVTWPEIDITAMTGATGSWRKWMPGAVGTWGGSYTCKADSSTAPSLPSTGVAAAATFMMGEGGAVDPTLSGDITTPRLVQRVRVGDYSELTYTFKGSGVLNQKAGTSLPGILYAGTTNTAITKPSWDLTGSDGTPDNTCVLTYASGRTFTAPCFWNKLSFKFDVGDLVRVTGTLRVAHTGVFA